MSFSSASALYSKSVETTVVDRERSKGGGIPGCLCRKAPATISQVHAASLATTTPATLPAKVLPRTIADRAGYGRRLQQRVLQYAIGTLDGEVIIEVVEISYCNNAFRLNNEKDIAQLYKVAQRLSPAITAAVPPQRKTKTIKGVT